MAAIQFPPYDSPPTDPNDYLVTPFEAPNGSKWTWGGDAKPRWTAWSEPPLTEIAWDDVTDKPLAVTALSGTNTGDQDLSGLATTYALSSGLDGKSPTAGSTSIVTLGTVTTGTWNGTTIAVANGGTGSTTASGARTELGLVIGTNVLAPNGNGSALTNLSWSAIGGTGTAASPSFTTLSASGQTQIASGSLASPAIRFSSHNTGFYNDTLGNWAFSNNGTQTLQFGTGIQLPRNDTRITIGASQDVGISYISSGVAGISNGTANNSGGSLALTNLTASGTVTAANGVFTTGANIGAATGTSFRQNGASGAGIVTNSNGSRLLLCSNNNEVVYLSALNVAVHSSTVLQWSTSSATSGSNDTGISRSSAGVMEVNNGTAGTLRDLSLRNLTASGTVITTPDTRSGAGAISITTSCTLVTSTGTAQALTLANGTAGQIKTIIHDVDGGDWILTPTTATGYTTISSTTAGDSVTLQYITTRGWIILAVRGCTVA